MEQFVYTSPRGDSITIDYKGDYLIESYDGLTAAEIEPITIKGYGQQGYTLGGISYGARYVNLNFVLTSKTAMELYQRKAYIAKVFNPLLGAGTLTYSNNYTARSIRCVPTVTPTPTEKMGLIMLVNVELTAYNPFWMDVAESAQVLEGFVGGLTYPLKFDTSERFAEKGAIATINITGDVESPIRAEFGGEAEKPRLTLLTTGEYIEVNTAIETGEKMIITTDYGNKNVILRHTDEIEESAYHLIDIDSTFFSLRTGKNKLTFSADIGTPTVILYWRNWYVGV